MTDSPFSSEYQPAGGTELSPRTQPVVPDTGETTARTAPKPAAIQPPSRDTSEYFLTRPKFDPIRARLIIESDDEDEEEEEEEEEEDGDEDTQIQVRV